MLGHVVSVCPGEVGLGEAGTWGTEIIMVMPAGPMTGPGEGQIQAPSGNSSPFTPLADTDPPSQLSLHKSSYLIMRGHGCHCMDVLQ